MKLPVGLVRCLTKSKICWYPGQIRKCSRSVSCSDSTNIELQDWKKELHATMKVVPDFVTEQEEQSLITEIDPYMKRLQYEFAHWDDAIHGFRETEKGNWSEQNTKVVNRIRKTAFPEGMPQIAYIHVLDLAKEGWIKPHVDSIRFCGDIIAGLSLLTDSVMRLTMIDHEKEFFDDFLLPRRSLYIMSGAARYKYKHEILKNDESYYKGQYINKDRRISVICRCEPDPSKRDQT